MKQNCLPQGKPLLLVALCFDNLSGRLGSQNLGLRASPLSHVGDWALASAEYGWVACKCSHSYFLLMFTFQLDWPTVCPHHLILFSDLPRVEWPVWIALMPCSKFMALLAHLNFL